MRRCAAWCVRGVALAAAVLGGAATLASSVVSSPQLELLGPGFGVAGPDGSYDAEELEDARRDLERAAREVARLSAQAANGPMAELIDKLSRAERRPMLGVNIADVRPYPDDAADDGVVGVRVVGVSPNGPADKAGIRAGDIMIALNGQPLDDGSRRPAEAVVLEIMSELEPGDPVAVRFLRKGTVNEVTVIAARFEDVYTSGISGLLESLRDGSLVQSLKLVPHLGFQGLELATISPSLGAYFGTTEGLLVVHVPESCGIGLEDGDVILRIDGEVPESSADALRLLRGGMGTEVSIDVLRHGQELTLKASIPAPPGQSQWSWQYDTD